MKEKEEKELTDDGKTHLSILKTLREMKELTVETVKIMEKER